MRCVVEEQPHGGISQVVHFVRKREEGVLDPQERELPDESKRVLEVHVVVRHSMCDQQALSLQLMSDRKDG